MSINWLSLFWILTFLRNIFEFLVEFVRGRVDILMISETKLDESFSLGKFKINGFNGESIMLFVLEDIPVKLIASEIHPVEVSMGR